MKKLFVILTVILWWFSAPIWAQEEGLAFYQMPDTSIITGNVNDALNVSRHNDTCIIGVYLMIDEGYEHTADQLVLPIKSYFDHYEVPAILVKQVKPLNGKGASMRIYVDGKCIGGDLLSGNLSLYELANNHKGWFTFIKARYVTAELEALERDIQQSIDKIKERSN